ncbi:MAG TPA: AI-2E family transporter [Actinomycetales bacterium]|nr:AI-2E family transporter [Actinomycetales bacterium]
MDHLTKAREAEPTQARPAGRQEVHEIARAKNAPEIEVPWSIRVMAAWSWRSLVILLVAVAAGFLVIQLSQIIVPAIIAVFLTVALEPLSKFLHRTLRFPRVAAAITTILIFVGSVVALIAFAGRAIGMGFTRLQDQAVAGFEAAIQWLAEGPLRIREEQLTEWLAEAQRVLQENASTLVSGVFSATSSIVNVGAGVFLVLFMGIFFLMDGRRIWIWFVRLLPQNWRVNVHEASIRSYYTLAGYVKAQVLVALIDAVGIAGGAFFLGVQLWLPIGVVVFLFSFIPIVGALLSGTIACLVALVDQGLTAAVILLIVVLAVQQIESNVLQPLIMGSNVSLHPVAVLLGVAGGTFIAGITGAVFAVPLMAFVNTFMLYLSGHDKYPRLATDPDRPGGPPGTLRQQIRTSYGYPPEADDFDRDDSHDYVTGEEGTPDLDISRVGVLDPDEVADLDAATAGVIHPEEVAERHAQEQAPGKGKPAPGGDGSHAWGEGEDGGR